MIETRAEVASNSEHQDSHQRRTATKLEYVRTEIRSENDESGGCFGGCSFPTFVLLHAMHCKRNMTHIALKMK
jgi:hypothetical protein